MNKKEGKYFRLTEVEGEGPTKERVKPSPFSFFFESDRIARWTVLVGLSCGWAGWGWLSARMGLEGRSALLPLGAVFLGAALIGARRAARAPARDLGLRAPQPDRRIREDFEEARLYREIHPDVRARSSIRSAEALAVFRTR